MSLLLIRGFVLSAVVAALPLAAGAQVVPNPPAQTNGQAQPGGRSHRGSAYMHALRAVNLNDGQKSQIRGIMQSYRQKNQGVDQTTRRSNTKQMRSDIMNVLSPAQRSQLQQQMRELRQQRQQNQGQNRPSGT